MERPSLFRLAQPEESVVNTPVRHRRTRGEPVGAGAGVVLKRRCAVYT
jgi:hypothetical protein